MTGSSKRVVIGAHYGLKDWLAQRITALVLALYVVFFALYLLLQGSRHEAFGYEAWAQLFAPAWMKVVTLLAMVALAYHAWIGVRDICMDYLKPTWVRMSAYVVALLWLAFCAVWAAQILWRV